MSYSLLPGSYEDLFYRAQSMASTGDAQGAIDLYSRLGEKLGRLNAGILERRPELCDMHRQARVQLARVLVLDGRYADAIEVEEGLLSSHPEQANIWRRDLAILRVGKGEVDRGLADLQALAEQEPDEAWTWILLGNEARIEGRHAASEAALEQAVKAGGRSQNPKAIAEAEYGRFLLLQAMGRLDEAVAAWEVAISREPAVKRTVREVYTMLTDAGRYTLASEYVERDDNALQAGLQRGLIAEWTGNPERAKQEWQAVAGLDPTEFEYGQECWAEAVLRLGNPVPVLERMQRLIQRHGTVRLLILSGIACAMQDELEPAKRLFEQSIRLLQRARPPKQKLDGTDWRLLHSLVTEERLRAALKPYFAVVETIWG
jgi:tetratricopeptide (TPR) repeat protein